MTDRSVTVGRRQAALLVKQAFGRLMDTAVASREVAAEYFVIWTVTLLTLPPVFYTVQRTSMYPWIRRRSIEALQQVALTDRLFFVIWSMLAAMLLASVLWDALVPDRTDQQILGVLPVRSRTVAAARLAAALAVALGLLLIIALPTAIFYAAAGSAHHSIGTPLSVFAAHLAATVGAGFFVFCGLVLFRATIAGLLGTTVAGHAALLMQLLTALLLVQSFMFLPGIVPGLVKVLLGGSSDLTLWPPVWFIAAYTALAGPALPLSPPPLLALGATAAVFVLAAAACIVPARANARRAIEARQRHTGMRLISAMVSALTRPVRDRQARALLRFTVLTLVRNRRPMLVVATYLGLGLAMAGVRLTSAVVRRQPLPIDVPYDYLVAVPLVLTFALAVGLRGAFGAAPDLAANWTFRLTSAGGPAPCARATRAAIVLIAVLPLALVVFAVAWRWWAVETAAALAVLHTASGVVLAELLAFGCRTIPFARAREIGPASLRVAGPATILGLHLFAFRLDDLQLAGFAAGARGVLVYVIAALLCVAGIRLYDRLRARPRDVSFEAEPDGMPQLHLSG